MSQSQAYGLEYLETQLDNDSQEFGVVVETQLDNDSQEFRIVDPDPVGTPDNNNKSALALDRGIATKAEEVKAADNSVAASIAPGVPPSLPQQPSGQRKAQTWFDMPRKFRGVMNHVCKQAASTI